MSNEQPAKIAPTLIKHDIRRKPKTAAQIRDERAKREAEPEALAQFFDDLLKTSQSSPGLKK